MELNSTIIDAITTLVGLAVSLLAFYGTYLINKKIKNDKLKTIMMSLQEVVKNAVLETYQTYVEELKDKDMFDTEAQKKALRHALDYIKANIPYYVQTWLESNFSHVDEYLKSLIEAQIGLLKNNAKGVK